MATNDVKSIIMFAIEKEEEAMEFYNELAKKVKHKEIAEELLKLSAMEKGHREKLKKLDVNNPSWANPKKVANLKIAEYTVAELPSADMSWQDVIAIAMKRELVSMNLYKSLASVTEDAAVKKVFETLASEEAGHKDYFEKLWDDKVLTEN